MKRPATSLTISYSFDVKTVQYRMCYIIHYNKSFSWSAFIWIHCDLSDLSQTHAQRCLLYSSIASWRTICMSDQTRSRAVSWFTILFTSPAVHCSTCCSRVVWLYRNLFLAEKKSLLASPTYSVVAVVVVGGGGAMVVILAFKPSAIVQ